MPELSFCREKGSFYSGISLQKGAFIVRYGFSERRTMENSFFLTNVTPDSLAEIRKDNVSQPNIFLTLARIIVQSATFSLTLPHFLLNASSFIKDPMHSCLIFYRICSTELGISLFFCPPPSFLLFSRPTI